MKKYLSSQYHVFLNTRPYMSKKRVVGTGQSPKISVLTEDSQKAFWKKEPNVNKGCFPQSKHKVCEELPQSPKFCQCRSSGISYCCGPVSAMCFLPFHHRGKTLIACMLFFVQYPTYSLWMCGFQTKRRVCRFII